MKALIFYDGISASPCVSLVTSVLSVDGNCVLVPDNTPTFIAINGKIFQFSSWWCVIWMVSSIFQGCRTDSHSGVSRPSVIKRKALSFWCVSVSRCVVCSDSCLSSIRGDFTPSSAVLRRRKETHLLLVPLAALFTNCFSFVQFPLLQK